MSVKLVIESSADINSVEAEKLGITMLPIPISFGEEEFMDGVDISVEEFYDKLVKCSTLPKTSMINEFRFEEAFEKHVNNGDDVVAIILSSGLSGTCNAAKSAAKKFKDRVFVVDSLSATAGIKLLVEYALRLIERGKTAKEIYEKIEDKKTKLKIMAMVDTLKYLKKGGRVSPFVAFAGELMGIKPMISVINGKVEVVGKVIGLKKAINYIKADVEKSGGIDTNMPFCAIYSGNDQTKINNFIQENVQMWNCDVADVEKDCIGATIGTHVGPGALGIAFFMK